MNQYYYQGQLIAKPMTSLEAEQIVSLKKSNIVSSGYAICLVDSMEWVWVPKNVFAHMVNKKIISPTETSEDVIKLSTSMVDELYKKLKTITKKKDCDKELRKLIYRINRQICIINKIFNQINQNYNGKTIEPTCK